MTTTTLHACHICGKPSPTKRCEQHGATNTRPSPWTRGYRSEFVRNRERLLQDQPDCSLCGEPGASVAHHDPPRRVLIATGVTNPDGLEWLRPLCDRCHRDLTAKGR